MVQGDFMNKKRSFSKYLFHRAYRRFAKDTKVENQVIAGSNRGYGIDISHWEESFDPDKSSPNLIDFAIFKATEGSAWKDVKFGSFYQAAVGKVPVLGAYHYLRSQYGGKAQAQHFINTVGEKKIDVLICDFENTNNVVDSNFVRIARDFGDEVRVAYPDSRILFYTNPSLYDNIVYPGSMKLFGRDIFRESPWDGFWVAQYYFFPSPSKSPSMPKTRSDWIMWQYSEAGEPKQHGTGGWCDQNVYNGDLRSFMVWIGKDEHPVPPTPDEYKLQLKFFVNGELKTDKEIVL